MTMARPKSQNGGRISISIKKLVFHCSPDRRSHVPRGRELGCLRARIFRVFLLVVGGTEVHLTSCSFNGRLVGKGADFQGGKVVLTFSRSVNR